MSEPKWKHDGVRVIPGNSLDPNTAQTPGMDRHSVAGGAGHFAVALDCFPYYIMTSFLTI